MVCLLPRGSCIVWRTARRPRIECLPAEGSRITQNADESGGGEARARFSALSDRVWETPELNYQEHRSAAEHTAMLEREGFRVKRGIAGMPTAVMGEAGDGGPVIAILGEYDALAGLSQEAGVSRASAPVEPGGNGHGCGHNLLGSARCSRRPRSRTGSRAHGLPGRVRYYGCPAEEGGSSKGFMVRAGLFDDVDIAICWHPAAFTGVNAPFSLACVELEFSFTGRVVACRGGAASRPQRARCGRADERRRQLPARAHAVDGARALRADRRRRHRAERRAGARGRAPPGPRARRWPSMWELVARVQEDRAKAPR